MKMLGYFAVLGYEKALGFQTPGEKVFGPQKHTWNTFWGGIWMSREATQIYSGIVS